MYLSFKLKTMEKVKIFNQFIKLENAQRKTKKEKKNVDLKRGTLLYKIILICFYILIIFLCLLFLYNGKKVNAYYLNTQERSFNIRIKNTVRNIEKETGVEFNNVFYTMYSPKKELKNSFRAGTHFFSPKEGKRKHSSLIYINPSLGSIRTKADKEHELSFESVLYHELGHFIDNVSSYQKSKKDFPVCNKYVSEYAKINKKEDFAETFMYKYLFPRSLMEKIRTDRSGCIRKKAISISRAMRLYKKETEL